jgi:hypothetical protein
MTVSIISRLPLNLPDNPNRTDRDTIAPMYENHEVPAAFWEKMLSRDPNLVRVTFSRLSIKDRERILAHLKHMTEETGWHKEQTISAQFALDVLNSQASDDRETTSGV